MTDIVKIAVTFGVQYSHRSDAEVHPMGMFSDGYAVIEAPNREIARQMAFAAFDGKFAFDYDYDEFVNDPRTAGWHPEGELLRIAWMGSERIEADRRLQETALRVGLESGVIRQEEIR